MYPFHLKFCRCTFSPENKSLLELAEKPVEEKIQGLEEETEWARGIAEIVSLPFLKNDFGKLEDFCVNVNGNQTTSPEHGSSLDLVNWCIDFLQFIEEKLAVKPFYSEVMGREIEPRGKVITIYNFIRFFLRIPKGHAYWLLNFLDWNGIVKHDSSLRNGWLNKDKYPNHHLSEERKSQIKKWIEESDWGWE